MFGSYLGETMLRNGLLEKGFKWGCYFDSNNVTTPMLIKENDTYFAPVNKVFKRLADGKQDDVVSFYLVAMDDLVNK